MPDASTLAYGRKSPNTRWRRARQFFKWFGRIAGGTLLVLLLLHGLWFAYAAWQLNQRIAALKQAGEPTTVADLAPPPVPPSQNGFDDLVRFGQWMGVSTPAAERWGVMYNARPPLNAIERDRLSRRMAEIERQCEPMLGYTLARPIQSSTVQPKSPLIYTLIAAFAPLRNIAQFLADDALLAHDAGDDAEALRRLAQIEPVAVAADSLPTLVPKLVGLAIRATDVNLLTELAPALRIGDGPHDAKPAAVRTAIAGLLDERAVDKAFADGMSQERVNVIDIMHTYGLAFTFIPKGNNAAKDYLLGPLYRMSASAGFDAIDLGKVALNDPDWPTAKNRLAVLQPVGGVRGTVRLILDSQSQSMLSFTQTVFIHKAARRMAAVALATRLYEAEQGRPPAALADLAPACLPALPPDPMSAGGTFRATFAAGKPQVWSVGVNGTDDNGVDGPTPGEPNQPLDIVVALSQRGRNLPDDMAALLSLNPDSPIEPSAATTQPLQADAPTAQGVGLLAIPMVNTLDFMDVLGDVAAFGFAERRDVLAAIANARVADADVSPTTQLVAALWGTLTTHDGDRYRFRLTPDGHGEMAAPGGKVVPIEWQRGGADSLPNYLH